MRQLNGQIGFLLGNRRGGYLSLSGRPASRYLGFFVRKNNKMLRVLENIEPDHYDVMKVVQKFWCVERQCQGTTMFRERYFPVQDTDAFVYESDAVQWLSLHFDVKESYDSRQYGRDYEVIEEDGALLVHFTKRTDAREDATSDTVEYSLWCAVAAKSPAEFKAVGDWVSRRYALDEERGSPPYDRWVYKAAKVRAKSIVVAVADTKEEALAVARDILSRLPAVKGEAERQCKLFINGHGSNIGEREMELAYKCCRASMDALLVRDGGEPSIESLSAAGGGAATTGLYAGLWWFFQFWNRDEAISCRALGMAGFEREAKQSLMAQLRLLKGAVLPNKRPSGDIASSDALGWLFLRIEELREAGKLSASDIAMMQEKLVKAIDGLLAKQTRDGMPWSQAMETWMDSLQRVGARIEICAQRVFLYDLAFRLTREEFYAGLRDKLVARVRDLLLVDGTLGDGAELQGDNGAAGGASGSWVVDKTIRPNIFIAYRFWPTLLSPDEWKESIERVIDACWCEWGGLATIDKNNAGYHSTYSGESAASYHMGDSWFWINNLAAWCMAKVDRVYFKDRVLAIMRASAKEILYTGLIGHHAELTSASELRSQGCPAQAWSAAMFIELIHEWWG